MGNTRLSLKLGTPVELRNVSVVNSNWSPYLLFFDFLLYGIWYLGIELAANRFCTARNPKIPNQVTKHEWRGRGGRGVVGAPHYTEGRPVCEHAHCRAPQPANRCTSAATREYRVFLNLARFKIQPLLHSPNHSVYLTQGGPLQLFLYLGIVPHYGIVV